MARHTPFLRRWTSATTMAPNERQPLLRNRTEEQIRAHQVTTSANDEQDYPIDQGTTAWLQVLGGFILFANSWGLPNTFGVFQTYYIDTLLPEHDAAAIAWIGSIQLFFTTIGCLPGGVLLDRGYLRSLVAVGTGLEVSALILTSFLKSYWSILFAQGGLYGCGQWAACAHSCCCVGYVL
jgi:hypothetical protein